MEKEHLFQLRKIVDSDAWDAVVAAAEILKNEIRSEGVIGNDEFSTLKMVFMREARVEGVDALIKFLEEDIIKR